MISFDLYTNSDRRIGLKGLIIWYIPTWGQNINSSSENCFTKRLWKSLEPNNAFAQCKQYGVFFCTKITYKVRLHHLLFSKMNIITKLFFCILLLYIDVLDYKVYLDDGTSLNDIFDYNEFSKSYNGLTKILLFSMKLFK